MVGAIGFPKKSNFIAIETLRAGPGALGVESQQRCGILPADLIG
jgi:hypothetical protein